MRGRARDTEALLLDAAAVQGAWGALLLAENVLAGLLWPEQFSGAWELSVARHTAVPMAFAGMAPLSVAAAAAWGAVRRSASDRRTAAAVAVVCASAGVALGLGLSHGRHFAACVVRVPFVAALAAAGAATGGWLLPAIVRWAAGPTRLAAVGACLAVASWSADVWLLPRLYPAFHAASLAAALAGTALVGLAFRAGGGASTGLGRAFAVAIALVAVTCSAFVPRAIARLDRASNVRIALVERAPALGAAITIAAGVRGVIAAARPDASSSAASDAPSPSVVTPGEVARALDWTGHDLVLVTVDALRADHVSAYGYARPTTPNIDALAREGTLFEHAYCPTPNTSYSLASMLTGKYIKPLLALGLGEDSETWAEALRRYGWRTAAFYPPAVFFIDERRFGRFERDTFGFEYAKVEFADAALRGEQVAAYLDAAHGPQPLFLWVHLFEPHEPYVVHAGHVFSGGASSDVDAYDSEVAAADEGIGGIVRAVHARRPGAVVIVTADHGEEFGEHGGRYHGTSVYEEQVRVPLIVVGPGVRRGAQVATVVQTIDLLPTTLSALGIPRPARVRGRDLGTLLTGASSAADAGADEGFAYSEADDYALVASGGDRLVCERRASACVLLRPGVDAAEQRDFSSEDPARFERLRGLLHAVERDTGRFEASSGPVWPEALRRGLQGEADAAIDVASLLDDADVTIRRKAAEVCFGLRVDATVPALRRALVHDEDAEVRRWSALALARMGQPIAPAAEEALTGASRDWRRRAALVFGERGDPRACDELAAWWEEISPAPGVAADSRGEPPRLGVELPRAEELLVATGRPRCRAAVPALVRALVDVRARRYVADALGAIGDPRARAALLDALAAEPYPAARPHEARALLALGARDWAADADAGASADATLTLSLPTRAGAGRLIVLLSDPASSLRARADAKELAPASPSTPVDGADPAGPGEAGKPGKKTDEPGKPGDEVRAFDLAWSGERSLKVELAASHGGVVAAWLVPRATPD